MKHELPPLPYSPSALEPFLSRESFQYHYGKHHKKYVEKTNELIEGTEFEDSSLQEIIRSASGEIFDNAAQVWNHTFYWNGMSPETSKFDSKSFSEAFEDSFESVKEFTARFKKKGTEQFGSGWIWLIADGKKLILETTGNAGNPLRYGKVPILVCDLWEHSYYIDYRNEREKFLERFVEHIAWNFVVSNFEKCQSQDSAHDRDTKRAQVIGDRGNRLRVIPTMSP